MKLSKRALIGLAAVALAIAAAVFSTAAAYDTRHVGEIYAVNVPGMDNWKQLSVAEAKPLARQYRWIYANASLKDLYEAKDEATKLSNAVHRPLVMVYMPRDIFDSTRNEYPGAFHASMRELIQAALADGRALLVTGRSYGVHQALHAVVQFNNPKILMIGIAPAFGAFGNQWSDNVKRYVSDVKHTRAKYCMIASEQDGFTWRSGGAAYKKKVGYRGDNDVGRAMKDNPHNVETIVLHGADHAPIDDYLRHGLVNAMRKCSDHFGFQKTAVADVVYGRRVAEAAQGQAQPGQQRPHPRGWELATDRLGNDYRGISLDKANPLLCETACKQDPRCKAWTYVKPGIKGPQAKCYLKDPAPAPRPNDCCVSGLKR